MSTNQKVATLLNCAADRLSKEGAWVQKALAKDAEGVQVPPIHATACQWCSKGAIRAETTDRHLIYRAEAALASAIGTPGTATWNDRPERTQAEVVAAFRAAAKQVVA